MKLINKSAIAVSIVGASLIASTPALAGTTTQCVSVAYACTSAGYNGTDPNYSYSDFARKNSSGYWHNCTMYIAFLMDLNLPHQNAFNLLGNAGEWASNAANLLSLGVHVVNTPKIWYVAQWVNGNHVAFVEDVKTDPYGNVQYIVVSEDNYSGTTSIRKLTPGDSYWPDNFIDFGFNFSSSGGGGVRGSYPLSVTVAGN